MQNDNPTINPNPNETAPQPVQPQVVAPDNPQPNPMGQTAPNVTPASMPAQTPTPMGGLSASQMGLNQSVKETNFAKIFLKAFIAVMVIALLAGGYFFYKTVIVTTATETVTNGGYNYSFKFDKKASLITLSSGNQAYRLTNKIVAWGQPTTDQMPSNCTEIGNSWSQALTVEIDGSDRPVCTPGDAIYITEFNALGHNHLFTVAFAQKPSSNTATSQLTSILTSVKVSH